MKKVINRILKEYVLKEIGTKRSKDTDIVYKGDGIVVLVPRSAESAFSYSRGTRWCTGGVCKRGSRHEVQGSVSSFNDWTGSGYILFRVLFKDGHKIRLSYNWERGDFSWGGYGNGYAHIYPKNMDGNGKPFDFDAIKTIGDWWTKDHAMLLERMKLINVNAQEAIISYIRKVKENDGVEIVDATDIDFDRLEGRSSKPKRSLTYHLNKEDRKFYNAYITDSRPLFGWDRFLFAYNYWRLNKKKINDLYNDLKDLDGESLKMFKDGDDNDRSKLSDVWGEFMMFRDFNPYQTSHHHSYDYSEAYDFFKKNSFGDPDLIHDRFNENNKEFFVDSFMLSAYIKFIRLIPKFERRLLGVVSGIGYERNKDKV